MQNIEEIALQTYSENLLFFQESHPILFAKLNALNHAIENATYTQKYALEYKESYFDVLELQTGNWLYNANSQEHATMAADSVDYAKTGNLYETFNDVRISDEYAQELENMEIIDNSYSGAAALINYSNKFAAKETTTMKKIYKFIFLGVGLGLHITKVHEKIKSNVYFIIEDDLELFRLSLFCTNYGAIAKDGAALIFAIFEDDENFKSYVEVFLETQFTYNHYIKFFHLLSHPEDKLQNIQNVIVGQTYLTFNYSALTISLLRPLTHFENKQKILNISEAFGGTMFMEKPVLILGAGPSFEKNIEWLKENYSKFIIVAVTPLLAKLEELNIKPDIITHIHGFKDALPHIQNVKDVSFFDKTISLFGTFTQTEFLHYFKEENIFLFEGSTRYKRWDIGITSSNIGSISYALFLMLKTHKLYLLGLDFATDQETGQTHSDTHNYNRNIELKEDKNIGGELIFNQAVIKTKGNLREEVFTTLLMNSWKDQCNSLTHTYKMPYNSVYNLSDGAYIWDTTPLHLDDKDIATYKNINKDALYEELLYSFNQFSENSLTASEIKNLQLRVDYCDNIIAILQKHIQTKHQNLNQYHYNILGVFYEISTDKREVDSSDADYIITLYLQFVSGYIFDIINTAEIVDEAKLIEHLDRTIMPQIIRIIKYFKKNIQKYLEYQEKLEL